MSAPDFDSLRDNVNRLADTAREHAIRAHIAEAALAAERAHADELAETLGAILDRCEDANREFVRLDLAGIARAALAAHERRRT